MLTKRRKALIGASVGLVLSGCINQPPVDEPLGQSEAELIELSGPRLDASRFLQQATFGANLRTINELSTQGNEAWLQAQFALSPSTHLSYVASVNPPTWNPNNGEGGPGALHAAFFTRAVNSQAQLRLRVAFALSEIMVISTNGAGLARRPAGIANYHDLLVRHAFGNYRDLIQAVSTNPMMGIYLSHLRNRKGDGKLVLPDENYAREVMQLFSIGLYELNPNGSYKLGANGKPIETYDQPDIANLARVFTGFSWNCGGPASAACFNGNNSATPEDRDVRPMQPFADQHSMERKVFLTADIAKDTGPNESLRVALDTLAGHANVGPFLGKQLIQRLTTSNPSPQYVARVSQAFNQGRYTGAGGTVFGSGTRGDMQAMIAAILLDVEARGLERTEKLKEPVLKLTAFMRAFNATPADGSPDGVLRVANVGLSTQLGQMPYASPSVFNFFRPGYAPPQTEIARADKVAPEFQITSEVSTPGYANFMQDVVNRGVPARAVDTDDDGDTDTAFRIVPNYSAELALAPNADQLVRRVRLLLTGERMRADTFNRIVATVEKIVIPPNGTAAQKDAAKLNRVRLAVYLTLVSTDFQVQ